MGGGYSSTITAGSFSDWNMGLFSINPLNGQLDVISITYSASTQSEYAIITNMDVYVTSAQWTLFFITQSRLMSTTGQASFKRYFC